MPYTTEWLVPGRVLLQRIDGDITLDDVSALSAAAGDAISTEGTGVVHSIVDVTRIGKYPQSLRDIHQVFTLHPQQRARWFIVITQNPLLRFLSSMVSQMASPNFRICASLEEAAALLQRHDHTLVEISHAASD